MNPEQLRVVEFPNSSETTISVEQQYDEELLLNCIQPYALATHELVYGGTATPADQMLHKYKTTPLKKPSDNFKLQQLIASAFMHKPTDMTTEAFVETHLSSVPITGINSVIDDLEYDAGMRKKLTESSRNFTEDINKFIYADDKNQYLAAKLLAQNPNFMSADKGAQLLMQDYAYLSQETGGIALYNGLVSDLESGILDKHIARDELGKIARNDETLLPENTTREIMKLLNLAQKLGNYSSYDEIIIHITEPDLQEFLPRTVLDLIDSARNSLITEIRARESAANAQAYYGGFLLKPASLKDIESFLHNNNAFNPNVNPQKERMLEIQARVNNAKNPKRKQSRVRRVGNRVLKESQITDEEQVGAELMTKNRTLCFIDRNGETFDENSEQFEAIIRDYTEEHKGQGLEDAVKSALDYLKNPMVVNGIPKGIVPVGGKTRISLGSLKNGNPQKHRLYRFRPQGITGFTMTSPIARKMRIYFTHDKTNPSQLNILKIIDKDQASTFLKNIGFDIGNS